MRSTSARAKTINTFSKPGESVGEKWVKSADGLLKVKKQAEQGLQYFGKSIVRPTLRHLLKPSTRTEAAGEALKRIKAES